MALLPIVRRELRTAARRRSTFRIRWWSAVLGLGCGCFFLLLSSANARNAGGPLFWLLNFYALGLVALAGILFASQSLAEERRQGTLGLLFLTDLKGYDVVLGKFAALWLSAFYVLLALLPATALPLLLGGVTGGEFWRVALALLNALFASLAAGLCVSACARNAQHTMTGTLGLLLLLLAALPAFGYVVPRLGLPSGWLALPLLSPSWAFRYAAATLYASHSHVFWASLLASHLLGWVLLGTASVALPKSWRESRSSFLPKSKARARGRPSRRTPADSELLSQNPVQWLRGHELGIQWRAWAVVLAWGLVVLGVLWFDIGGNSAMLLGGYAAWPFGFLLKLLFAWQACRFFAEARRNGALELLLCTPLSNREIIRGQIFALWRSFLWPLLAFFALLFAPAGLSVAAALSGRTPDAIFSAFSHSALSAIYSARMILDLFALCWFGIGLSLTMKRPALAPALTILLVLVAPSVLCWGDILADIAFIAWGINRCQGDLRRLLSEQYQTIWPAASGPATRVPPVIGFQ